MTAEDSFGRLVGFVGGLVGSGGVGSVDMGLDPFIQLGHRRDLYKLRDKTEAGGLPRTLCGAKYRRGVALETERPRGGLSEIQFGISI